MENQIRKTHGWRWLKIHYDIEEEYKINLKGYAWAIDQQGDYKFIPNTLSNLEI